ncbi:MAG: glycosyltransferase family 2 protein [Acidobacteria bacterium]|nr:glycosyltransferase family 2 protein [Acidobacteriota bacterium]
MRFTVAVCTWNRAALLSRALERLARVQQPAGEWELLVVNNNSDDDTERVLDSFESRLPLRRAFEPEQGLSHARNRAVEQAAGEYIVWTDDDALVGENWLAAYGRAVERYPDAAFFGGPIRPRFEGTPPRWLSSAWREVGVAFAARDLGEEPFELAVGRLPFGANYVIRAREQRQFPYDPALGRRRDGGAVGEETAVLRAVLAAGGTGRWVPDAPVEHWIPKERQTTRYLREYYALQGKTFVKTDAGPLRLWCGILYAESAYALARLGGDPRRWLKPLVKASLLRGSARR